MRTIVVTVFCVCTSISAAAQITSPTLQARPAPPVKPAGPTIKGHALGESIAEFLAVAGQPDLVSQCRSLVASSPAPSKKKGGGALNSVFGVGDADKERQDRTARDGCSVLISGVDTGARIEKLLDEGTFEGARLVRFDVRIGQDVMVRNMSSLEKQFGPSFDEVAGSLAQRFGKPQTEEDLAMQNGYGAVFHHRCWTWSSESFFIRAYESQPNAVRPGGDIVAALTDVTIETPEERRREIGQVTNRPNPID
jgi:hypothetical protein